MLNELDMGTTIAADWKIKSKCEKMTLEHLIAATSFKFSVSLWPYIFHTYHAHILAATVMCDAETTAFFFWPDTLAGTTRTLQCPNTTTMISRTCSLSGMWESVDLTLCTSFTSINTVSFTMVDFHCDVHGPTLLYIYRMSPLITMKRFSQV